MDSTTRQAPPLKILIVDDDQDSRALLKRFLKNSDYELYLAENGREGVERFVELQPDIVLMDIMMPEMNGYEATRAIKERAGDRFVPVIFLTAVSDDKALAKCVEYGGDDFLTKPYSRVILNAKIDALRRVGGLYATLQEQRDELVRHEERMRREHELAEEVFTRIARRGQVEARNIRSISQSAAISNGDLLLADRDEEGVQYLLLGDFTGHGLSAALGALPVAELFHNQMSVGGGVTEIARAINAKLREVLPTGMFLCAGLVEFNPDNRTLQLWLGGLPDALLYRAAEGRIDRITSRHLPLGVVGDNMLELDVEALTVQPDDRLYLYSDGIIEARNETEELFGEGRLTACFEGGDPADFFTRISSALEAFRGDHPQDDDITLLELTC